MLAAMTNDARPVGGFTETEWEAARPWDAYLASIEDKRDLWEAAARRAEIDEEARARLEALPGPRRVLVVTEDWCGDAARSVPVIAAACELSPQVEHRYLESDDHPDVIARWLTKGGRAIPVAVVQDERGLELGAWGPRPAALQALLRARIRELGPPAQGEMASWYAPIMGWYGKDKGRSIVEELLMLLERGGEAR
jgi:hypothetical protein